MSDCPDKIEATSDSEPWTIKVKHYAWTVYIHAKKHTGVGIICAVAYFDPGNWGVDLQAGSQFGYKLLFIVLLAGLFAVFLQVLASRLGCVTGLDLASHCRLLLHDRPKHTRLYRWLALYPLYALSEIAIVSTDLAELLGSAMALSMLFPKLPLWAGVLLTGADVIFLLALGDPLRSRPLKMFEFIIAGLVLAVLICMAIIISRVDINWGDAFDGFVPSKAIFQSGGLYTSVGILGATVMPHSLFLGSTLATQDRVSMAPDKELPEESTQFKEDIDSREISTSRSSRLLKVCMNYLCSVLRTPPINDDPDRPKRHADRENNPLPFVLAHIYHGIVDMVVSLLGFAVVINAMILILASAVFYYGSGQDGTDVPASLFDAHNLIGDIVGKPAAVLFALALLAAGQSASIVATVAGQCVSEGFLQWRVSPVVRRLVTRLIGLIPSMVVAIAVGSQGLNTLLVASQVVLSIVLPFIMFPLIWLTSSKRIMRVRRDENGEDQDAVDFSNGIVTIVVGGAVWLVVVAANLYVIVTLAMGSNE